ncbi:MAG: hypothetical protein Q9218_007247, partial [Villophora microphyllina]
LDAQHNFMRNVSGGRLTHPSIPSNVIQSVADVATGTGIWLQELVADSAYSGRVNGSERGFVGFDISPQQFPSTNDHPPNVTFVVHDMTETFPSEYHEKFDLVNVRFVSYVVEAVEVEKVVWNTLQLLKPGGYLQWQEGDACDSWSTPETPATLAIVNHVISEKVARGLLAGVVTPLIKAIMAFSMDVPEGRHNPISRSSDLMRITHIETISTLHHPSPVVQASKQLVAVTAAIMLLESIVARKRVAAKDPQLSKLMQKLYQRKCNRWMTC